jgi:hypothetical protein
VYWLEAVIIRFYSVEQRDLFKPNSTTVSDTWVSSTFISYLRDLGYPRVDAGPLQLLHALDWILTYAIDLEYQDNADRYNAVQSDPHTKMEERQESPRELDWDATYTDTNTDINRMNNNTHTSIRHLLHSLASSLGVADVTSMSESLDVLWIGLYHILRRRYSASAIYDATQHSRGNRRSSDDSLDSIHGDVSTLITAFPAGFSTASMHLDHVTTILRLLYMHDLKQLQFDINRLVAEVQMITASPQTDVSLGHVGRG